MIFSVFFYVAGFMITSLAKLLSLIPFVHWPDSFITGIGYFGEKIMLLNFILPVYEFLELLQWIVIFFGSYYFIVLLASLVNWIRGSGEIKV